MNLKSLLLKLLPGLLPLIVFIIADEIWGTTVGLWVAIVFGALETIVIWVKERRFDKFVLFDTRLIVALGGVSLLLENEVFFLLKPAIIGVLVCILLGVSAFTPKNFVLAMSQRYFKDIQFNDNQYKQLNRSMKILFFITVFHTALVFYSVWFMSKEAWAFISGGLFYILIALYFGVEWGSKFMKNRKQAKIEWLPLTDVDGKIIGKATRQECHSNKSLMHPVVHMHVFNNRGQLYLQKRSMHKTVQPGKWDTAVGGHIDLGETIETGLEREAFEELGIKGFSPQLALKYIWKSDIETELVFAFVTTFNAAIIPHKTELDGGKFWNISDINNQLGKGIFTPNFEHEFELLKQVLQNNAKNSAAKKTH